MSQIRIKRIQASLTVDVLISKKRKEQTQIQNQVIDQGSCKK